jgi:hypothetical protein
LLWIAKIRPIGSTAVVFVIVILLCPLCFTQSEQGSICVAPISKDWPPTGGPNLICASNDFSLKIDDRKAVPWSAKKSAKIDGLDLGVRHRIVVYCDGKVQQSFRFSFSQFKNTEVCLFLNDLYKTAQLWEPKQSPWCKCK